MSYIGNTKIGRMFLGGTEIAKAYLGSVLVFQKGGQPQPQQYTITINPSSYDTEDIAVSSISNPSNAYADENNTTYARIFLVKGTAGAVTYVYFRFDTSRIPANATINSVSCDAKIYMSNTNSDRVAVRKCQMCSGTTAKGTAINATTTPRVVTFSGEQWTRNELNDVRIKFYAERGTNNLTSNYYFQFYGATLTITYTV